jgi:hypothetical protein
MQDKWYYRRGNESYGPVTGEQLRHLADSNRITCDDLVWLDGTVQWVHARQVKGLFRSAGFVTCEPKAAATSQTSLCEGVSPPGKILPAILIQAKGDALPGRALPAIPVQPREGSPPAALLVAKPAPTAQIAVKATSVSAASVAATIPIAQQSPKATEGSPIDFSSMVAPSRPGAGKHVARQKKIHPAVWVAIGVPTAFIGLAIIGAIVGGSSDKSAPGIQEQLNVANGSPTGSVVKPKAKGINPTPEREVSRTVSSSEEARPAVPAEEREQKPRPESIIEHPLTASPNPTGKSPAPDADAQTEAAKLIKKVYGDEWVAAKTAAQKQALAKKLLQTAKETDKDNAARFVLLRSSRDIATQAMAGPTAFQAVDEMDRFFQIDALDMKATVLTKGASIAATPEQHKAVAEKAAEVAEEAVTNDNFSVAIRLSELASSEAKKGNAPALVKRTAKRAAEIGELAKSYELVKGAAATLDKTPDDPEANLAVGGYRCFIKGDWDGGLPMLARGSDATLKKLATKELAGVASSDEQAELGDGWWGLAAETQDEAKSQFQARAAFWYRKALPGLSGLARNRVEKRLQQVPTISDESVGPDSASPKQPSESPAIAQAPPNQLSPKAGEVTPGYSIIWRGEGGRFLELKAIVGSRNRVDIEIHARGFQDASQAKAAFDSATPQVVTQLRNSNQQLNLVPRKLEDGKVGGVFVRKIRLSPGR